MTPSTFRPRLLVLVDAGRMPAAAEQLFWLPNSSLHFSSDIFLYSLRRIFEHNSTIESEVVVVIGGVVDVKVTRLAHLDNAHFFSPL